MKMFATTPYGELHLRSLNPLNKTNPTHNWTGPFTRIDKRLFYYDTIMTNYNEMMCAINYMQYHNIKTNDKALSTYYKLIK